MAHYRDKSCTISLSKVLNCTLVYTETFSTFRELILSNGCKALKTQSN